MAISDLVDVHKFKELRRSNPTKAKNLIKKIKKKNAKKIKKEKKNDTKNNANEKKNSASGFNHNSYVEYVEEEIEEDILKNFEDVYKKFSFNREANEEYEHYISEEKKISLDDSYSENDEEEEEEERIKNKEYISKKALKLLSRPSVMKLKEFAKKPELVEIWDTTASDPYFFVWLKCLKNSVPVPQQWCQKRKYMHGKRGIEKLPYILPPYIQDTKISEIRQAIKEKEEQKSLKQKMRDRVRPKLHTMDIDYQTLHDAFFKYATKPKLVKFSDVYYEGKEFELKTKKFRPGVISEKLRKALNIEPNEPLPWLFNMQKYGLPPSFPYLSIPGLNSLTAEQPTGNVSTNVSSNVSGNVSSSISGNVSGNISSNINGNINVSSSSDNKLQQESGSKIRFDNIDESGNIIYGNFISHRVSDNTNKYDDDFLWGEIDENYEDSEEESEENENAGEEDGEEKKKSQTKEQKEKNENTDAENINIDLNDNMNEDMLKNNYASGIYSVVTNSKLNGSYTPYMESGLTSVDLTSFVPGYETPKYVYTNNYMSAPNNKPYTVLQKEDVPISQNNLFASNIKYKISPSVSSIMNKASNITEGEMTPFTNIGVGTPYVQSETGKVVHKIQPATSNVEDIKKELSKFEEISNKAKLLSAQVDNPKKPKKDEKKKKKKKYFKF
ncbi:splicing factor 3B subunit 2, putative [Plasmodium malariae]|uniref:Splicing factor 3B subunit 2, putative n=1 Tax=Plasmodium malariae TaxID=5858 RepID=A0A1C3L1A5_PLAMA|nr:splicing factor 3B subunit 2, putative [Plasmodium malariae]